MLKTSQRAANSFFLPLILKMAQLRQRVQWLHPGIALSIDNPGGIALDVLIFAEFGLRRIGPARTALDIRNTASRTVKKFFLLAAVWAPRRPIKFDIAPRQVLG